MKRQVGTTTCVALVVLLFMMVVSLAHGQDQAQKVISVSSVGTVKAKPDTAILLMEVRSTSPLASNALETNANKITAIKAKLNELQLEENRIEFSGDQFTPAGGGRYFGGQRPTGFDVFNTLKIRIPMSNKSLADLGTEIASLLDTMSKVGASVLSPDISRISLGGNSAVAFTLENSEKFEKKAYELAIAKARPVAEEIAKKMGVKITGIHSVLSRIPSTSIRPYATDILDSVHFSTSPDEITIKANVTVNFSFK